MALEIGNLNATTGMSKAIFDQLDNVMMSPADKNKLSSNDLKNIRDSWRKLAFAISKGVIDHIKQEIEISGIKTKGNIRATVSGNTSTANSHAHPVNLQGVQNNVEFEQSNSGTGLVE